METFYILALGFLLGIEHALEADHLMTVTAIVSRYRDPRRSALAGLLWGIGHSGTLLIAAVVLLSLNVVLPPVVERAAELMVGLILAWLGVSVIRQSVAKRLHIHAHRHGEKRHAHFHTHEEPEDHEHPHGRSILVGMAHGLAGSGALMLLVLSRLDSPLAGLAYVLLFGAGSILGMLIFSGLIGIPLAASGKAPRLNFSLRLLSGIGSLGLGLFTVVHTLPL